MAQGPERGWYPSDRVSELAGLPGVIRVQPVRRLTGALADSSGEWNLRAGRSPRAPGLQRGSTLFTARSAQPWSVWRFRPHTPWDSWARGPESASWTACSSRTTSPSVSVPLSRFVTSWTRTIVVEPGLEDPPGIGLSWHRPLVSDQWGLAREHLRGPRRDPGFCWLESTMVPIP